MQNTMQTQLIREQQRGAVDIGWLQSKHTFSFGEYYNPNAMGFSALRVINDDHIQPSQGFGTHPHRDMEIITYVLKGAVAHKDSMGNVATIPAGEIQLMSAGSGVQHSEFNPSNDEVLHLLQIWIQPNVFGQEPAYYQQTIGREVGFTKLVSPSGADGALPIRQDASLLQLIMNAEQLADYQLAAGRKAYVHVVAGQLRCNDIVLTAGDGLGIEGTSALSFVAEQQDVTALLFDLP